MTIALTGCSGSGEFHLTGDSVTCIVG